MKKSMLFSISAFLVVLGMWAYAASQAHQDNQRSELATLRTELRSLTFYANDFETYYIPKILEDSAVQAIRARSRQGGKFTPEELEDIMKTGGHDGTQYMDEDLTTEQGFRQALQTQSFELDDADFDFHISSASQPDYKTMKVDFLVDYSLEALDTRWYADSKMFSVTFHVYSFWHPVFHDYITKTWVANETGCYLKDIMDIADDCSTGNIMPG